MFTKLVFILSLTSSLFMTLEELKMFYTFPMPKVRVEGSKCKQLGIFKKKMFFIEKKKPCGGLEPPTLRLRVSRATDCASKAL